MVTSTKAFFLYPPAPALGGAGHVNPPGGGLLPEDSPAWLWGQGTPGAIAPFTTVNKGSVYSEVNATDDYGHMWVKQDEGGDAADWARMLTSPQTIAQTYVDTELHAWELNYTATAISAANMVGLNVAVTTAGTAASWISGIYAKITQGSTKNVNGYLSAAEFELVSAANSASAMFTLVLNFSDNATAGVGSSRAFIALREYGTNAPPALFWLGQEFVAAVGATSNSVMWTTTGTGYEDNVDYAIRVIAGDGVTPYWIPICSTGPAG